MRLLSSGSCCFLLSFSLAGQIPVAPPPGKMAVTPDTVIATVAGKPLTVAEFERITTGLDQNSRKLASENPKLFLQQMTYADALVEEAEKTGLDQRTPYREQLERARRQILTQAILTHKNQTVTIPAEEVKKYFEANREDYRQARVKVIFISRETHTFNLADRTPAGKLTAEDSKKKAASVAERAKSGEDFVKLAKEFSDDKELAAKGADLPVPIRPSTESVPAELKTPILAAKPGEIVGPVDHASGFYVFRVESMEEPSFEASQADIEQLLKRNAVRAYLSGMQKRAEVSLTNDPFWKAFADLQKSEAGARE
jgi:parvulin-like peptidyl-prolyl isomerase